MNSEKLPWPAFPVCETEGLGEVVSVALLNTSLAQGRAAGHGLPPSAPRVFSAPTRGGDQHSPLPRWRQAWQTWRGRGEHLPDFDGQECFAHTPISRSFANLRVVMWFAFSPHCCLRCSRCCFQNLFLLLFLAQGCNPSLVASLPFFTGQQPFKSRGNQTCVVIN